MHSLASLVSNFLQEGDLILILTLSTSVSHYYNDIKSVWGQFSFYALTGVNWVATYNVWTNVRFVMDSTGCTCYINNTQQAFIAISDINTTAVLDI